MSSPPSPSKDVMSQFSVQPYTRSKPEMSLAFAAKKFKYLCVIMSHGAILDYATGQVRASGSKDPNFMFESNVDMIFPVQYGTTCAVGQSVFREIEFNFNQITTPDGRSSAVKDPCSSMSGAYIMQTLAKLECTTSLRAYDANEDIPNQSIFTSGELERDPTTRAIIKGGMYLIDCIGNIAELDDGHKNLMESPTVREILKIVPVVPQINFGSSSGNGVGDYNEAPEYKTTDGNELTLEHLFDKQNGTFKELKKSLGKVAVAIFTCRTGLKGNFEESVAVASPTSVDYTTRRELLSADLDDHTASFRGLSGHSAPLTSDDDYSSLGGNSAPFRGFGFSSAAFRFDDDTMGGGGKSKNRKKSNKKRRNRRNATKKRRNRRNATKKRRK
jgi:hypothetical protein